MLGHFNESFVIGLIVLIAATKPTVRELCTLRVTFSKVSECLVQNAVNQTSNAFHPETSRSNYNEFAKGITRPLPLFIFYPIELTSSLIEL